jgi:hypothetical protein
MAAFALDAIWNPSGAARIGPGETMTIAARHLLRHVQGKAGIHVRSSSTPASIIPIAPPGGISSAGWNSSFTVPANWSRRPISVRATTQQDRCVCVCPQACITPSVSRPIFDIVLFQNRERIHVGPDQHDPLLAWAITCSAYQPGHARAIDAGPDVFHPNAVSRSWTNAAVLIS